MRSITSITAANFEALEVKAEKMAKKYDCPFVDNEMPYGRVPQGHPVIDGLFLTMRKSEGQRIQEKEIVKQKLTAL